MIIKFENGKYIAYATKEFRKKAHTFGTPEFYEWRAACKEFGMELEIVTKSRSKSQNEYKNLTYANMIKYIITVKDAETHLEMFETIKQRSRIQENPRKYVQDWFKATFPEVMKDAAETNNNIVDIQDEKISA